MDGFGARLKQIRESRHVTQHDLANRLRERGYGTTQTTVSRWESGQVPRGYVARALAAELGVSLDELFGSDEDEEAAPAMDDLSRDLMDAIKRLARAEAADVVRAELEKERTT
jgi:transcriptional regulator with XRE-family HTH domain